MKQVIFPLEHGVYECNLTECRVAIVLHLFYLEQMEDFIALTNQIPREIDVFIISSRSDYLVSFMKQCKRDVECLEKTNRGRDVSALLVTFKERVYSYKYVCFVHDKKESEPYLQEDILIWNRNLRENTIGSSEYIKNVIGYFEQERQVGVMVPPLPLSAHYSTWLGEYLWENVYEKCKELKERLKIELEIEKDDPIVTIGGVLWFRVNALRKIFDYPWDYSDFPDEPMPSFGTISHAIERMYAYLANDQGYEAVTVMSDKYAEMLLEYVQKYFGEGAGLLKKSYGIHTISQYETAIERRKKLLTFCNSKKKIYIYGDGDYGIDMSIFLQKCFNIKVDGFLVSNGYKTRDETAQLKVFEVGEVDVSDINNGIIVSAKSKKLQSVMKESLREAGCDDCFVDYEL